MSRVLAGLALLVGGWLLSGTMASAQDPTVAEQIELLKKQLAQEKARALEMAALLEQARAEAQAQRDQARNAEEIARAEARRALATLEAAQKQFKKGDNQPRTIPEQVAQALAEVQKAQAELRAEEARLAEINGMQPGDARRIRAQEARIQAARKGVADAEAQLARALQKQPEGDQPTEIEKLRKELQGMRQDIERALTLVSAREKQAEAETRDLLAKLQVERARAEVERARAVDSEIERRALLDRVKSLEKLVADLEKRLKEKPANPESK
jgi:chromosome segregation ATPase